MRRIAYVRATPFTFDDIHDLLVGKPTVHQFSSYLEKASDAWLADLVGGARAAGTVGGRSLLVTYGKLGMHTAPGTQAIVERHLARRWGPLVVVTTLLEADRWFQRAATR